MISGGCDRESRETPQPQASEGVVAQPKTFDRSHKGSELPDFTLTDAQGNTVQLADFKGKPLLINLWATWCAPCVVELPTLNALATSRGDTLNVVTVSQDMAQTEKVAAFLTERGLTHLQPWLDPDNDLSFHYVTGILPTTILYDAQGQEVWRFVGEHDWNAPETAARLAEATPRAK